MSKLFNQLQTFQSLDSKFPINAALTFLYVVEHNPCLKVDMEEALGFTTASGSRNTDYLSKVNRLRKPGLDLITKKDNPDDRRQVILTLTPKGEALANQLGESAYALDRSG